MRRIQVHFPETLDDTAAAEAARRGMSKAAFIRESVAARLYSVDSNNNDPWESMIGWLDDDPISDIDEVVYEPRR
ncbi:MAG TPA: CopG family transcriptional regulator [Chloroflexota bacterium]|jgi:hypothetical protein|nr:CopG family transcriptional regulator [Chloroflexota bacterium]